MTRRPLPLTRLRGIDPPDRGLHAAEAAARAAAYGPNAVEGRVAPGWLVLARDAARDPMIWFLVGTAALYAVVGERLEALVLLLATVPLVGMDVVLHWRTRASVAGLHGRLATTAVVVRDGDARRIAAADVVPGDLVLVGAGEWFPADGLVVAGEGLQADESALTGEAHPVRKRPASLPADGPEPAVAGVHWGFAGTRLLTGRATVRVVFTGAETVYGEIVRSALGGARGQTPLQAAIADLVAVLVAAAAAVCLTLAAVRLWQGHGWLDAVVSALTLAVAALPEEFPVVFTVFLGVGVHRLARRQALVRRAVSVENIGRVSCICTDKTGTITEGRLRLTHLVPAADVDERRLLALAASASRAETGDPLDAAILVAAGAPPPGVALATFPFTEDRRRETTVVRDGDAVLAATKGAAEVVLAMTGLADAERRRWEARVLDLAREGHKVVACAWRPLDGAAWAGGEPDRGYRLAGLLACEDPVRPGVAAAIAACREAGIHTIMLTGDHPATARAVAVEIGLGDGTPRVITAADLDGDDLRDVDVVARAVPGEKLAIVRALQEAGEMVAVTGDGVNDVPALQAADVGIAMGERGTQTAREVAAVVLLDDDFATIVRAIAEGRQLFRNLRRSFEYLLLIHIPFVITAALVPLAGYPLLYLPVHLVWLELVIHPTALLVFQALPPAGRLERARRHRRARFFSLADWARITVVGALLTLLVAGGYVRSLGADGGVPHARAMALAALTAASAAITAALGGLRAPVGRVVVLATLGTSVLLVQTPGLAPLLHLAPLHADDWALAVGGAALIACLPPLFARLTR